MHQLLAGDRKEALALSDFSDVRARATRVLAAHGYTVDATSGAFGLLCAELLRADVASDEVIAPHSGPLGPGCASGAGH